MKNKTKLASYSNIIHEVVHVCHMPDTSAFK